MKHIFVFVDKLMHVLNHRVKTLDSEDHIKDARKKVDQLVKYTHTLKALISTLKKEGYLEKLKHTNIHEIDGWAEKVSQAVDTMDQLLDGLDEYIPKLQYCIDKEPLKWGDVCGNAAMRMVMIGMHDDEEVLMKLREHMLFEERKLRSIIKFQEHVDELF